MWHQVPHRVTCPEKHPLEKVPAFSFLLSCNTTLATDLKVLSVRIRPLFAEAASDTGHTRGVMWAELSKSGLA